MEYISKRIRAFSSLFSSKIKVESPSKIGRNIYLENIFKILSWNDPYLSWGSFLTLNFLFWLVVQFELKLIGIIFFIILMLFIYDNLFKNIGSSNSKVIFSDELEQCLHIFDLLISSMCNLRKESPSSFCLTMSIFFLVLSFVARSISGILLTYLILLGLFFLPLGYYNLPIQVKQGIRETLKTLISSQDVIEEDDLIPFQSRNKLEENEGDLESLDDKTAESVTNSLISGISSMPSFLDAEENNELLEEDLMPINSMNREITPSLGDLSSDSDLELRDMHFKESHFSRDSSSDDGSKFEEGLHFSEDSVDNSALQNGANRLVQGLVDYVASASTKGFQLPGFVNNVMSTMQTTKINRENSSSDSDFEVINPEDVKQ